MNPRFTTLCCFLLLFASCAMPTLSSDGATGGRELVSEKQNRATVRIVHSSFSTRLANLPQLAITATNRSAAPVPFGPADITLAHNERPVRIYSYGELAARIRREAEFARYSAHKRADMRADAIAYDTEPSGSESAIQARMNGYNEAASATWSEKHELAGLNALLHFRTLDPGATASGDVFLHPEDLRESGPVTVHVRIGQEDHTFTLHVQHGRLLP